MGTSSSSSPVTNEEEESDLEHQSDSVTMNNGIINEEENTDTNNSALSNSMAFASSSTTSTAASATGVVAPTSNAATLHPPSSNSSSTSPQSNDNYTICYSLSSSRRDTRRSSDSGTAYLSLSDDIRDDGTSFESYNDDDEEEEEGNEEDGENEEETFYNAASTQLQETQYDSTQNVPAAAATNPFLSYQQHGSSTYSSDQYNSFKKDAPCRNNSIRRRRNGINRLLYSHLSSHTSNTVHWSLATNDNDDDDENVNEEEENNDSSISNNNKKEKQNNNMIYSLLAREMTGKPSGPPLHHHRHTNNATAATISPAARLKRIGGSTLFDKLDNPSSGIATETMQLSNAMQSHDWNEVQVGITKLLSRLIGDPNSSSNNSSSSNNGGRNSDVIQDSSLPPNTSPYYGGGGRLGLERYVFIQTNGVQLLLSILLNPPLLFPSSTPPQHEKSTTSPLSKFYKTKDARDIPSSEVTNKLSSCWNECLILLRELIYAIPALIHDAVLFRDETFTKFLFTLLSHSVCFDACAALIEEILSLQGSFYTSKKESASHSNPSTQTSSSSSPPPSTFFLGSIPNLYTLWSNFTCRQAAHFCRILALLIFEPEDRIIMESSTIHKSLDLLQLRRDRGARNGLDATVDMNQSLLLDDDSFMKKMLDLLVIMNYGPDLCECDCYHVLMKFPWIADTLIMLGLSEVEDWEDVHRLDCLARELLVVSVENNNDDGDVSLQNTSFSLPLSGSRRRRGANVREARRRRGRSLSHLGNVGNMLSSLSGPLLGNNNTNNAGNGGGGPIGGATGNSAYLGHIINVINAAQQAGIVVGRRRNTSSGARPPPQSSSQPPSSSSTTSTAQQRRRRSRRRNLSLSSERDEDDNADEGNNENHNNENDVALEPMAITVEPNGEIGVIPATMNEIDQNPPLPPPPAAPQSQPPDNDRTQQQQQGQQHRINTPEDAANELQFNALLLAPYQVEVLFVLCTLLGGKRKIDAQRFMIQYNLVNILDDMFYRLSWGNNSNSSSSSSSNSRSRLLDDVEEEEDDDLSDSDNDQHRQRQQQNISQNNSNGGGGGSGGSGLHGPGCECNPESALRVQYLRLLHNFCDRDCDNYAARRLLLSPSERNYIFGGGDGGGGNDYDEQHSLSSSSPLYPRKREQRGLLSKVIHAFIHEPDDSPYKFWLASCAESYLRGSSSKEQLFVAQNHNLLLYLLQDVLSDKLHCAGSLQTTFDLLGELCKGNVQVLQLLVNELDDEDCFRRLMNVAAENLVDSNVFLRALLLTVERAAVVPRQRDASHYSSGLYALNSGNHFHDCIKTNDDNNNSDCESEESINWHLSSWCSETGTTSRSYLTHTWWDIPSFGIPFSNSTESLCLDGQPADTDQLPQGFVQSQRHNMILPSSSSPHSFQNDHKATNQDNSYNEWSYDESRESDWFPPFEAVNDVNDGIHNFALFDNRQQIERSRTTNGILHMGDDCHDIEKMESISPRSSSMPAKLSEFASPLSGSMGWTFIPPMPHDHHHHHTLYHGSDPYNMHHHHSNDMNDLNMYPPPLLHKATYEPNTIERIAWFLTANQTRLLRDLLDVVNLQNINHENICCLNTAVVLAIFAQRRNQLAQVLDGLRYINMEEDDCINPSHADEYHRNHRIQENVILLSLKSLNLGNRNESHTNSVGSDGVKQSLSQRHNENKIGSDYSSSILKNFRELLWFWKEYYTNRGRDRLSLEFSSHLRFQEWENVVKVLCADDGTSTSLVSAAIKLPKSPYKRSPRCVETRLSGY